MNRLASFARRGWARLAHGAALAFVLVTGTAAGLQAPRADSAGAVSAAALAIVFGWAAGSKAAAPSAWGRALDGYGLPRAVRSLAVVGAPVAEAAVPVLVVIGLPVIAGGVAIALLAAFSGAILMARARRGDRLPCGCFGGTRVRDYRAMLARNAVIGAVAVVATLGSTDPLRSTALALPTSMEWLPAGIVVVSVAAAVWTLSRGLFRLRRVE